MKTFRFLSVFALVAVSHFLSNAQSYFPNTIPANSPAGINGKLKVIGNNLCNQYDKPIQLRGMSTHGIQWFYDGCYSNTKITAFDTLKSWGADILRISMYVQEDGYETDPTGFTNKVKTLVDVATARGMYALVDFHQLDPGDPNYNTQNAKTFFTAISTAFKDYTNVLYDICNEPNGSTVTWPVIKQYADQVIPVIRAIDNDAVITVGTHGWATFGYSNGQSLTSAGGYKSVVNNKLNYPNIMYSFHFYADSHGDPYLAILDAASNELPVFVTEFGFQNSAGEGTNNRTMSDKYITLMRNKKITWCNWNFSDDSRTGAVWKAGTCGKNSWKTADLKEAGIWVRDYIRTPADDFPTGTTNQSPTVSITSPANNATFNAGANITINATAADQDQDGTITKVEFFYGTTKIGEDLDFPYSITWNNAVAGIHQLTAKATDNKSASTTSAIITITVNAVQSPYGNSPKTIPGKIEAEEYDNGGQGVAFNDVTALNEGGFTLRNDAVDIEPCTDAGAGLNIGYVKAGEWLEYTVNVANTGKYDIELRVASASTIAKTIHIEMNGTNITGAVTIPNTGGWQTWQTVVVPSVSLTAGQKVMKISMDTDDYNLNFVNFKNSIVTSINDDQETSNIVVYPNPANNVLSVSGGNFTSYRITAITGATVAQGTLSDSLISIESLESGSYMLELSGSEKVKSIHFVKE